MQDAASGWRRRRRLALGVAGALVAVGVVLGTLGWAALGRADRLLARASWALGREVVADGLRVALFGGPSVTVTGLRIAEDPAVGSATPFVTASRLVMRLDVPALLARRLLVNRVTLDTPVVQLARDASGRLNVASLGRGRHRGHGVVPPTVHGPRRGFALGRMTLRHGTIRYVPQPGGHAFTLSDVTLDARGPRFGALVPVSASGRLEADGLAVHGLASDGMLDLTAAEPVYRGRVRGTRGTIGPLAFTALSAHVTVEPSIVEVHGAALALLGGSAAAEVKLVGAGEDAGLTTHVDATGLDLATLAVRDGLRPAGRAELHADVTGPSLGSPGFGAALAGHGTVDVADGALPIHLGTAVLDELQPIVGEQKAERLRERFPDLFADDLRFTHLTATLTLGGGTLGSDDLVVTSASYAARGRGTVGLDRRVEFALEVTPSPALTTELVGHGRTRTALLDGRDRLVIPLRVHGTLDRLRVSPEPEFSARVARALIGGDLGDRAGELLERLLRPRKRKGT